MMGFDIRFTYPHTVSPGVTYTGAAGVYCLLFCVSVVGEGWWVWLYALLPSILMHLFASSHCLASPVIITMHLILVYKQQYLELISVLYFSITRTKLCLIVLFLIKDNNIWFLMFLVFLTLLRKRQKKRKRKKENWIQRIIFKINYVYMSKTAFIYMGIFFPSQTNKNDLISLWLLN